MLRMGMSLVLMTAMFVVMTLGYRSDSGTKRNNNAHSSKQLEDLRQTIRNVEQKMTERRQGSIFIHWGSRDCKSHSKLIYKGFIGGSNFNGVSAAVNNLCLPDDIVTQINKRSIHGESPQLYSTGFQTAVPEVVACAVCDSTHRSSIMIPGQKKCLSNNWMEDYEGYLMVGHAGNTSATENICVDQNMEIVGNQALAKLPGGGHLHKITFKAGVLESPDQVIDGGIVFCVVCSGNT